MAGEMEHISSKKVLPWRKSIIRRYYCREWGRSIQGTGLSVRVCWNWTSESCKTKEFDQINSHSARQEELRPMDFVCCWGKRQECQRTDWVQGIIRSSLQGGSSQEWTGESGKVGIHRQDSWGLFSAKWIGCSCRCRLDELNLKLDKGTALQAKIEEERDRIVAESS